MNHLDLHAHRTCSKISSSLQTFSGMSWQYLCGHHKTDIVTHSLQKASIYKSIANSLNIFRTLIIQPLYCHIFRYLLVLHIFMSALIKCLLGVNSWIGQYGPVMPLYHGKPIIIHFYSWNTINNILFLADLMADNQWGKIIISNEFRLGVINLNDLKKFSMVICHYSSRSRIYYRKTSSINRTKSQNLNVYNLVFQLSLLNPLKPGVKSRMKM